MTDLKTTASGLFAALPAILSAFGIGLPVAVVQGVQAIGLFLVAYFAKDKS